MCMHIYLLSSCKQLFQPFAVHRNFGRRTSNWDWRSGSSRRAIKWRVSCCNTGVSKERFQPQDNPCWCHVITFCTGRHASATNAGNIFLSYWFGALEVRGSHTWKHLHALGGSALLQGWVVSGFLLAGTVWPMTFLECKWMEYPKLSMIIQLLDLILHQLTPIMVCCWILKWVQLPLLWHAQINPTHPIYNTTVKQTRYLNALSNCVNVTSTYFNVL